MKTILMVLAMVLSMGLMAHADYVNVPAYEFQKTMVLTAMSEADPQIKDALQDCHAELFNKKAFLTSHGKTILLEKACAISTVGHSSPPTMQVTGSISFL